MHATIAMLHSVTSATTRSRRAAFMSPRLSVRWCACNPVRWCACNQAAPVRDSEKQYNSLFLAEMTARKNVIDAIWEERKTVEKLLGRGGRSLARFIFFDFRSSSPDKADDAPAPAPASPTTPATPEKPK